MPEWLELDAFDFVVLHYSILLTDDSFLPPQWRRALAGSTARKALFIQDDYRNVDASCQRMREIGLDVLFTVWPRESIDRIYNAQRLPGVKKVNVLTGYVPEVYEASPPDFEASREIDVSYRARGDGFFWMGELVQEKGRIGTGFQEHARRHTDLKIDISLCEEDRLCGDEWIRFLRNSRCVLGSESGASVVDFSGEIETRVKAYVRRHPRVSFEEVRDKFFKNLDGKYYMNQISPRVFEAIGCGCGLVLFEGNYSGVLQPGEHFIPLKKDFSNVDDVIAKIKDRGYVKAMARRTYDDIVATGKYSYQAFIRHVDSVLDESVHVRQCRGGGFVSEEDADAKRLPTGRVPELLRLLKRGASELANNPIKTAKNLVAYSRMAREQMRITCGRRGRCSVPFFAEETERLRRFLSDRRTLEKDAANASTRT